MAGAFSSAFSSAFDVGAGATFNPALAGGSAALALNGAVMLKKNTAGQVVSFRLVNASTGAALTGATVSVRRCLDGTFGAAGGTVTEDSGGLYKFAPTQADTNADLLAYYFTATSAVPEVMNIRTTAADLADTVRLGLTAMPNATAGANTGLPVVGTQVPNATAGAAGGLFIAGTNAATTVTTSFTTTFTGNLTGSVGSVTGAVGSVTGAVGSVTGNVGGNVTGSVGSVVGAVGSVTGNVGGNVTGSVGSVATGGITAASFASDAITAAKVASDVSAEIADAVWDELLSGHVGAGSAGAALSAAGSAGDPWGTALPGAYSAGTAGFILGTNLDAAVSTRSTYAGADTSGTTTLLGRLTSTRAGYIDNLSAGAVALASGVTVTTNNDKTGYSLSQSFPTNFATLSIDGSGKVLLQATQTGVTIPTVTTVTNNPGLDAAGVRTAVGLASANLDTQLGDLPTAAETATAVLAAGDVDGYTLEQTLKLCLAALAGKISGAATTTVTIRSADDSANRLVATCDSDGNRTAVTLNAAG